MISLRHAFLFAKYRSSTMVRFPQFVDCLRLVSLASKSVTASHGCVVECGTWKGGMSAAMMEVCGRYRDYYCFDSFKGLPPVTAEDGDLARAWQHDVNGERFFDNCRASLEQFKSTVARSGVENSRIHIVQGFFEKSLSSVVVPPILILRLDADWYQSTIVCLERFWDLVVTGGVIVIDDYHDWEGCRKAVHEFLARRKLNEAIEQTRFGRVVHIKKGVVSNAYARDLERRKGRLHFLGKSN